ncbi:MAG: hypothetical protein KDD66_04705 [Bdellovibrionales bacterium]|nr:hypothetical protein [Bdellovibrionales bacterium]
MKVNKVVSFLLLRPAFTGRNVTSLGLVAVFFMVYVLAGGKITTVPTMKPGGSFGSVESAGSPALPGTQQNPQEAADPAAQPQGQAVSTRIDSLFGSNGGTQPPKTEARPARNADAAAQHPDGDKGLDDIEARLKGLSSKRGAN